MNGGSASYKSWAVTDIPVPALGPGLVAEEPGQSLQPPLQSCLFSLNPSAETLRGQDHSSQASALCCAMQGSLPTTLRSIYTVTCYDPILQIQKQRKTVTF